MTYSTHDPVLEVEKYMILYHLRCMTLGAQFIKFYGYVYTVMYITTRQMPLTFHFQSTFAIIRMSYLLSHGQT